MNDSLATYAFVCGKCRSLVAQNDGVCPYCQQAGVLQPRHARPFDERLPAGRVLNARQLIRQSNRTLSPKCYPNLKLGLMCFVVIWGLPGAGKTLMLLRLAADLVPAVFLPLEMGCGGILSDYCRRLELCGEDLRFAEAQTQDDIAGWAENCGRALLVDSLSISTLEPRDCERLARGNGIILIGTLQSTKDGSFAGTNSWLHSADVGICVEDGRWRAVKSRFGSLAEGSVL